MEYIVVCWGENKEPDKVVGFAAKGEALAYRNGFNYAAEWDSHGGASEAHLWSDLQLAEYRKKHWGNNDYSSKLYAAAKSAVVAWGNETQKALDRDAEEVQMRWWVSWYCKGDDMGKFELHTPWWISGSDWDGNQTICAAVIADSEEAAREVVFACYDDRPEGLDFRFVNERAANWSPFGDRFRKADWMKWPEGGDDV